MSKKTDDKTDNKQTGVNINAMFEEAGIYDKLQSLLQKFLDMMKIDGIDGEGEEIDMPRLIDISIEQGKTTEQDWTDMINGLEYMRNVFSARGREEKIPQQADETDEDYLERLQAVYIEDHKRLTPYISEVLHSDEYRDITAEELFENGAALWTEVRLKAQKLAEPLPQLKTQPADMLDIPVDRVNKKIMEDIVQDKLIAQGQQKIMAAYTQNRNPVPVKVSMQLNDEELEKLGVKKAITHKDRLIMEAISTIYARYVLTRKPADKDKPVYCTLNMLWRQMGGRSVLNDKQITALEKELQKLATTWVELDTSRLLAEYTEQGATGRKIKVKDIYKGNLIHVEIRQRGIVDGKECKSVVKIYADPILLEYARDLDQITAIPLYVIQATGSLTDDN